MEYTIIYFFIGCALYVSAVSYFAYKCRGSQYRNPCVEEDNYYTETV